MCDFNIDWGSAIGAAVGAGVAALAPKPNYQPALAQSAKATNAALAALAAQNEALLKASTLTVPVADSASAQAAADALRRKKARLPATTFAGNDLTQAPVAVKYLTGA